jgi:hypothetical protein
VDEMDWAWCSKAGRWHIVWVGTFDRFSSGAGRSQRESSGQGQYAWRDVRPEDSRNLACVWVKKSLLILSWL